MGWMGCCNFQHKSVIVGSGAFKQLCGDCEDKSESDDNKNLITDGIRVAQKIRECNRKNTQVCRIIVVRSNIQIYYFYTRMYLSIAGQDP